MFKSVITIFRGRAAEAEEAFVDANALPILRQQIRDAAAAITRSRQAVAVAIASETQEVARYEKIKAQIKDLEARAVDAIEKGKGDLAQEAAEAIAALEDEKASSETAQARYRAEISRLKQEVRTAQLKLRDLERGQRLAVATDKTQRLANVSPISTTNSLREAEETLARLETRQQATDLARKAEADLAMMDTPTDIAERMANAGLGNPMRSSAEAVLERLKKKTAKGKKAD